MVPPEVWELVPTSTVEVLVTSKMHSADVSTQLVLMMTPAQNWWSGLFKEAMNGNWPSAAAVPPKIRPLVGEAAMGGVRVKWVVGRSLTSSGVEKGDADEQKEGWLHCCCCCQYRNSNTFDYSIILRLSVI